MSVFINSMSISHSFYKLAKAAFTAKILIETAPDCKIGQFSSVVSMHLKTSSTDEPKASLKC